VLTIFRELVLACAAHVSISNLPYKVKYELHMLKKNLWSPCRWPTVHVETRRSIN